MIKFSVMNTVIIFDFSFFAVMALICIVNMPVYMCSVLCACMLHELGHLIASLCFNIKINRVVFWAGGVRMVAGSSMVSYKKETIVLLCGPAANIIIFAVCFFAGHYLTAYINLALALFNLLPFSNLDGGTALKTAFQLKDSTVHILAVITSALLIILFAVNGIVNLSAYITIILLIIFEFFFNC